MTEFLRRWFGYRVFSLAGRIMPTEDRERILRIIATGDPEERASAESVVVRSRRDEALDD